MLKVIRAILPEEEVDYFTIFETCDHCNKPFNPDKHGFMRIVVYNTFNRPITESQDDDIVADAYKIHSECLELLKQSLDCSKILYISEPIEYERDDSITDLSIHVIRGMVASIIHSEREL